MGAYFQGLHEPLSNNIHSHEISPAKNVSFEYKFFPLTSLINEMNGINLEQIRF